MKAIEITSFGAPEVLRMVERPAPVAGAGELLIRVAASGVNRPDVLQRTGNYPVPPGASDLPGLEVAGEIVAGDAQALAAHGFKLGDQVCALVNGGGYAELCTAPIGQCLPVPKGWTLRLLYDLYDGKPRHVLATCKAPNQACLFSTTVPQTTGTQILVLMELKGTGRNEYWPLGLVLDLAPPA